MPEVGLAFSAPNTPLDGEQLSWGHEFASYLILFENATLLLYRR